MLPLSKLKLLCRVTSQVLTLMNTERNVRIGIGARARLRWRRAGQRNNIIGASEYLVLYTQLAADFTPSYFSFSFLSLDCDLELGCSLYSYGRSKILCSYCRPTDCCLRRTLITPHPSCFASSMLLLSSTVLICISTFTHDCLSFPSPIFFSR